MLSEMSSEEFMQWELLEQLEPFGERAEYMRNALLCAILVNINRSKDSPAAELDDYMPPTLRAVRSEPQGAEVATPEAVKLIMEALMEKQNTYLARQKGGNA